MNPFKSPYRESGISSLSVTGQPKRRKVRLVGVYDTKIARDGHLYQPTSLRRGVSTKNDSERMAEGTLCRRCGKPKFLVEGQRCSGRKKQRRVS